MPAGNTYEAIATQTLGSAAASVTFSSIPGTYTDLVMVFNGSLSVGSGLTFQVNGATTGFSDTFLIGYGSSASSGRDSNVSSSFFADIGTTNSTAILNFMNYSNTTTFKTVISRGSAAGNGVSASVGLWRSTSAINEIKILSPSGNITTGSTFSLFGIASA
jgi:hypothetical protein